MPRPARKAASPRKAAVPPRQSHGERRRGEILGVAVDVGSAEGLGGLSIGRLAEASGMSKSGLFAHFGSKQELQLATIEAAAEAFETAVMAPASNEEPGLLRLRELLDAWLTYVERSDLRGGCFFFATSAEYGSQRGPLRDRLARYTAAWLRVLENEARVAVRQGELAAGTDPRQLAFELHAFVQEANWARELLDDAGAFRRAHTAIAQSLRRASGRARGN